MKLVEIVDAGSDATDKFLASLYVKALQKKPWINHVEFFENFNSPFSSQVMFETEKGVEGTLRFTGSNNDESLLWLKVYGDIFDMGKIEDFDELIDIIEDIEKDPAAWYDDHAEEAEGN